MNINVSLLCIGAVLLMALDICSPQYSLATEEYAKQTGQSCSACHRDPAGGGELTAAGTAFSVTVHNKAKNLSSVMFAKGLRLVAGYIHILTAIFWFGTILYVHLVLKPSYAAGGLPRAEVRVGIVSMVIMGVTGAILTFYRITSLDALVHTRFGILLIVKITLYLIMVTSAAVVITVIGPRLKARKIPPSSPATSENLTLEELATYDGQEGRPAYFAFEGKIYDTDGSWLWKQGLHMGRHNAGSDLTDALKQAPHGRDNVTAMRKVGILVAAAPRKMEPHEKVFYVMAYMNLGIVYAIVLILTLWRWG